MISSFVVHNEGKYHSGSAELLESMVTESSSSFDSPFGLDFGFFQVTNRSLGPILFFFLICFWRD